jgi:hypothetical protein
LYWENGGMTWKFATIWGQIYSSVFEPLVDWFLPELWVANTKTDQSMVLHTI